MTNRLDAVLEQVSRFLVPVLFVVLAIIYVVDSQWYRALTDEDGLLEWLTVIFLCLAGLIAFCIAMRGRKNQQPNFWFFLIFSLACLLCALEEISWGQRIFDIQSSEFFLEHNDQRETNIHNVIQKWGRSLPFFGATYDFKTKHVAGLTLLLYGAFLPILAKKPQVANFCRTLHCVIPPRILSVSFFIAALMMIDVPTGQEEEIGEFFFSLCFVLFMLMEYLNLEKENLR